MSASKQQKSSKKDKENFDSPAALSGDKLVPQKRPHKAPQLQRRQYESEAEGSSWIKEQIMNPKSKRQKRQQEEVKQSLPPPQVVPENREEVPEYKPVNKAPSIHYSTKISSDQDIGISSQSTPQKLSQEKDQSAKKENELKSSQDINDTPSKQEKTYKGYLNQESLKHHLRITACVKLNFSKFIESMFTGGDSGTDIKKSQQSSGSKNKLSQSSPLKHLAFMNESKQAIEELSEKKKYLDISQLQIHSSTKHIVPNKLSDKLGRRDIVFYDLYVKKDVESVEDLSILNDKGLPLDIDAEQHYNELEVDDFNHLFYDNNLIEKKFGKSIKVTVTANKSTKAMTRRVVENPDLISISGKSNSPQKNNQKQDDMITSKDPELINIHGVLKQLEKDFGKTHDEIADIFVKVSGRLDKMKDYLAGRPVLEWNGLEDLALEKPEESPEFQVLLSTKGWEEILLRREFLQAVPVLKEVGDIKGKQ